MSAIIETPILEPKEIVKENHIVLPNISWSTYESLLNDLADTTAARLTYNQGKLEIMAPLPEHERINRIVALIVEVVAEELNIDIEAFGSTTFKHKDFVQGFEPDSCFYIQHEAIAKGKTKFDLKVDPPPDLIIEIDITNSSIDKLSIYKQLAVPEIWRYDGKKVIIYKLENNDYQILNNSSSFPLLTSENINYFITQSKNLKKTVFLKSLRAFLRDKINAK
ncbi:MAG: Uma2 family endonuclease [Blastocatellia bacterium]|nr:Uma2 family endonuclease [Blastocatellia bacterium]